MNNKFSSLLSSKHLFLRHLFAGELLNFELLTNFVRPCPPAYSSEQCACIQKGAMDDVYVIFTRRYSQHIAASCTAMSLLDYKPYHSSKLVGRSRPMVYCTTHLAYGKP